MQLWTQPLSSISEWEGNRDRKTERQTDIERQTQRVPFSPLVSLLQIAPTEQPTSRYFQEILIRAYFPSFQGLLKNIEPNVYILVSLNECFGYYKLRVHFKCDLTLGFILLFSFHISLPWLLHPFLNFILHNYFCNPAYKGDQDINQFICLFSSGSVNLLFTIFKLFT